MIWLIIIALALFLLWPSISKMFNKDSSATTPATQFAAPSGGGMIQQPGAATQYVATNSAPGATQVLAPKVGPLAGLLGNTVGTVVQGVVSIPRNLIGGIFRK